MITQQYFLDMIPGESTPPVVHVSQFDVNSRTLVFNLMKSGVAYVPAAGTTAKLEGTKPDGTAFSYQMTVNGSAVSIEIQTQMTVVQGNVKCEVVVTDASGKIGSANFILAVEESAIDDGAISETDIPILRSFINGGADGQVFVHDDGNSGSWQDAELDGATWGNISGTLSDQTDLQDALNAKQDTLTFDNVPTAGSNNPVTSSGIAAELSDLTDALNTKANIEDVNEALALKQDALTFDATPTANSNNPVYSKGIKSALDAQKYFYIDSDGYGCINYDLFQTA